MTLDDVTQSSLYTSPDQLTCNSNPRLKLKKELPSSGRFHDLMGQLPLRLIF